MMRAILGACISLAAEAVSLAPLAKQPPAAAVGITGPTHSVVKVDLNSSAMEWLFADFAPLDFWMAEPSAKKGAVSAHIHQSRSELALLRARFPEEFSIAEILMQEGQTLAAEQAERARLQNRTRFTKESMAGKFLAERKAVFFEEFRDYEEINIYIDLLLLDPPGEVRGVRIGESREGNVINAWEFTGEGGLAGKPAVYLQGTAHANEWMGTMGCIYAMTELIEGYRTGNEDIVRLMDELMFIAVPVLNPDGYLWTWTATGRNWRKNRRDNGDGSFGVDLNRNNGPARTWCTAGSSTNPSSNTYCGPEVLSEPEDRYMGEFIAAVQEQQPLLGAVDYHTCGSLLLWPWQYTTEQIPEPDYIEYELLGLAQEAAINAVNDGAFRSIQGVDLYPHSGGFIDYMYDEFAVLGYTYEGSSILGGCHVQPPGAIVPSSAEQFAGVLEVAKYVLLKSKKLSQAE